MQKHILLVDSDAASRSRLSQALLQHEYRVSAACSCDQCLALLEQDLPDCIIFDVDLEGTSGTIMYSRLRRNSRTRHIPAIVCTNVGPRLGTKAQVLRKSCSCEDLLCSVEAALAS